MLKKGKQADKKGFSDTPAPSSYSNLDTCCQVYGNVRPEFPLY